MRLAAAARQAGYRLNSFDSLGSTNDEALARARSGDRGRLWITAASQGEGRGRQGRAWASPSGNLYASLLLVDAAPPARVAELSVVAGVALVEAAAEVLGAADAVVVKWPNDMLAGGAKLGGILVEGTRVPTGALAVVAGFGVNCASHPSGLPYPATDLASVAGSIVAPSGLFEALSGRMAAMLTVWNGGLGFAAVRDRWLARTVPVGTPLSADCRGRRVTGAFETMDASGRLILRTADGPVTVEAGDVMVVAKAGRDRLIGEAHDG